MQSDVVSGHANDIADERRPQTPSSRHASCVEIVYGKKVSMFGSWWFIWMIFMFLFLVPPLGYGWGYRRWGAPYPSYIQRRRATANGGVTTTNHRAWGFGGDFVWIVMMIGLSWALAAVFWR